MWRWLALGVSAMLMTAAAILFFSVDRGEALPAPPPAAAPEAAEAPASGPPEAIRPPQDREAKRLARYDKDKDGAVSRDEFLRARERAFAKLDTDGDGRLSFDEYAVKTVAKFSDADKDRSGVLSDAEFATTAVKRKPKAKPVCPPDKEEADG